MQIHYIGYEDRFDEWREKELEDWKDAEHVGNNWKRLELYQPFNLHQELDYQIKSGQIHKTKSIEEFDEEEGLAITSQKGGYILDFKP